MKEVMNKIEECRRGEKGEVNSRAQVFVNTVLREVASSIMPYAFPCNEGPWEDSRPRGISLLIVSRRFRFEDNTDTY